MEGGKNKMAFPALNTLLLDFTKIIQDLKSVQYSDPLKDAINIDGTVALW